MQVGSWVAHKSVGVLLGVWIAALGCFGSDEAAPGAVGSAANPDPVEARRGAAAAVDDARLRAAGSDGANWLSYGRTQDEQRFSPLKQIDAGNVGKLGLAWYLDLENNRGLEATPLVSDGVLYAWRIYPVYAGGGEFFILKFDQVVHGYLYAVVGLLFLHLLREYFGNQHSQILVGFIAVMAALGVSGVNELIEFIAVLTVPDNGVGGYFNLMLDMVFNFAGAMLAVLGFYLVKLVRAPQTS